MSGEESAASQDDGFFDHRPDPDQPGWWTWELRDTSRYNALLGSLRMRPEGRGARLRMVPERRHSNLADAVHGGAISGLADISLFAACRAGGLVEVGRASTLELSLQFMAPARLDRPLDSVVEILRETGRLIFLRGLMVQQGDEADETVCAAFSATVRKASRLR